MRFQWRAKKRGLHLQRVSKTSKTCLIFYPCAIVKSRPEVAKGQKTKRCRGKKRAFHRRLSVKDTAICIGISQGLLLYSFTNFFSEARLQFGRVVKPQMSVGWKFILAQEERNT